MEYLYLLLGFVLGVVLDHQFDVYDRFINLIVKNEK